MLKKILIVFGTRPEAIKMAPLVKQLNGYPSIFTTRVCVTAQHRQMLDQVLETFDIVPDFDLNVMAPGQDLFDITAKVLLGMKSVFAEFSPDLVLVHGDTTTSMAAGMAAFYGQIKVGHVEAGLRTYNLSAPWPEEMNRQVTDRFCDYYFAPTIGAKENLLNEQISEEKILVTGNTVIDALLMVVDKIDKDELLQGFLKDQIRQCGYVIDKNKKYILVTGHRRENFGDGFLQVCAALKQVALKYPEIDIVYPVHLNPNVQKPVFEILSGINNIYLMKPLDYVPFVFLMRNSYFILTDSGGVQEEAPSLGKPVLVMRETTERPEAVDAGTVRLVGTDTECIVSDIEELLNNNNRLYSLMSQAHNPYGDGKASFRIAEFLKNNL